MRMVLMEANDGCPTSQFECTTVLCRLVGTAQFVVAM